MELETTSDWAYAASHDLHIPIDLFGSKKHAGLPRGTLAFADSSGNIVFKVHRQPPNSNSNSNSNSLPKDTKLLLDANDNHLFSIHRHHNGCWKCYKGSSELVFEVKRNLKTLTRVELEVIFAGGERSNSNDDVLELKIIGSPFKRSCNIYKDADLVAQLDVQA
ncbi:protein LURP-one-related 7 isoform X2 [Cicer arietinum]|uniref:Protein LURP-one-related 7 isoform X2 n=1 Tax=Cicer arietinum TaxID=3827 RepID=A0A3Q7XU50_CICAR|nr:protein LURP-one-related 7 isoform X2 [Cicer arietinum]